jgi:hypothetical protein
MFCDRCRKTNRYPRDYCGYCGEMMPGRVVTVLRMGNGVFVVALVVLCIVAWMVRVILKTE